MWSGAVWAEVGPVRQAPFQDYTNLAASTRKGNLSATLEVTESWSLNPAVLLNNACLSLMDSGRPVSNHTAITRCCTPTQHDRKVGIIEDQMGAGRIPHAVLLEKRWKNLAAFDGSLSPSSLAQWLPGFTLWFKDAGVNSDAGSWILPTLFCTFRQI